MKKISFSKIIFLIFSLLMSCTLITLEKSGDKSDAKDIGIYYKAQIIKVIDGDTVKVCFYNEKPENCQKEEIIRLIGVNTPELNLHNENDAQYFAKEAYEYTNKFWKKDVYVFLDDVTGYRDKYSRLLSYIKLTDGRILNKDLIENGYGYYYGNFKFNKKMMNEFLKAQEYAEKNKKGLWKNSL